MGCSPFAIHVLATIKIRSLLRLAALRLGVVSPSVSPSTKHTNCNPTPWLTGVKTGGNSGWRASTLVKFTTRANEILRDHRCHHRLLRGQDIDSLQKKKNEEHTFVRKRSHGEKGMSIIRGPDLRIESLQYSRIILGHHQFSTYFFNNS